MSHCWAKGSPMSFHVLFSSATSAFTVRVQVITPSPSGPASGGVVHVQAPIACIISLNGRRTYN